jgi:tetratricopeptide (TPR) repeat protein
MKRAGSWLLLVLLLSGCVWAVEGAVDQDNLSLKAGPTEPGEKLSLVWVESFVYPKQVGDDRMISLGVRTASRVREVRASFDFSREPLKLASTDGLSWSAAFKISNRVPDGAHIVRYAIAGRKGSIQRTVDFYTGKPAPVAAAPRPVAQNSGWPLTVLASCSAYSNNSARILAAGQTLVSISKLPWYKVRFNDGKEGWIPSTAVKDPADDYFQQATAAYDAKHYDAAVKFYQNVLAIEPGQVKAYLGLAKSYQAQGQLSAASEAVQEALKLDERDPDSRAAADDLAQKYFLAARDKENQGRPHEAIGSFRKMLELKPDAVSAWLELGRCFRRLGLAAEAREAWRSGLKADPDNRDLRTLLGSQPLAALDRPQTVALAPGQKKNVASLLADESVQLIKNEKTSKGTKIEAAIQSVIGLTKSLGTPIAEKGWQIKKRGEKLLVSYLCEQSGGALESFDWLVDIDTRQVSPHNENARVLMSRW